MALAVPADHRVKLRESEKEDKYLDLARELEKKPKQAKKTKQQKTTKQTKKKKEPPPKKTTKKKTMKHESNGDTNCNLCARYSH